MTFCVILFSIISIGHRIAQDGGIFEETLLVNVDILYQSRWEVDRILLFSDILRNSILSILWHVAIFMSQDCTRWEYFESNAIVQCRYFPSMDTPGRQWSVTFCVILSLMISMICNGTISYQVYAVSIGLHEAGVFWMKCYWVVSTFFINRDKKLTVFSDILRNSFLWKIWHVTIF